MKISLVWPRLLATVLMLGGFQAASMWFPSAAAAAVIEVIETIGVSDAPAVPPPMTIDITETIGVADAPGVQPSRSHGRLPVGPKIAELPKLHRLNRFQAAP